MFAASSSAERKKDTSVIMHYTIMPAAENRKLLHSLGAPPTSTKSTPGGLKKGTLTSLDVCA